MGLYDIEDEENLTAAAIAAGQSAEEFEKRLDSRDDSGDHILAMFLSRDEEPVQQSGGNTKSMPSLFTDDFAFARAACEYLRQEQRLKVEIDPAKRIIEIVPPDDLKARYKTFPAEVRPDGGRHILCDDKELIQAEIQRSRKDESAWPKVEYLWELSPVLAWLGDKLLASFRRHTAAVITVNQGLEPGEIAYLLSSVIPNRRGQPIIHRWFSISVTNGRPSQPEPLEKLLERTRLGATPLPNPGADIDLTPVQKLLPDVVEKARQHMRAERERWSHNLASQLSEHERDLEELRQRHIKEVQLVIDGLSIAEKLKINRSEMRLREIQSIFDEHRAWLHETMTTEDAPYIKVAAVLRGAA